jgi:hypothetical protein
MPDPPIEVRDDTRAFLAWERRTRDEIASGRRPAPTEVEGSPAGAARIRELLAAATPKCNEEDR